MATQKAVSSLSGKTHLYINEVGGGDRRIYNNADGRKTIEVDLTMLDDFFGGEDIRIDLLKMGIEGTEPSALTGMKRILEKDPKIKIISEFYPRLIEIFGYSAKGYFSTNLTQMSN